MFKIPPATLTLPAQISAPLPPFKLTPFADVPAISSVVPDASET